MLDDDITPVRTIRETWSWLPAGISVTMAVGIIALVSAGIIAGIIMLLIPAGNAIQKKNIQNGYSNTVNSQGYQQALYTEMTQNLSNIADLAATRASLPASSPEQQVVRSQQLAQVRKFCTEGGQFTFGILPGDGDLQDTYSANCQAGAMVANPPLAPAA